MWILVGLMDFCYVDLVGWFGIIGGIMVFFNVEVVY